MTPRQSLPRPRQAVILAGGLGTRLRPLTDYLPKPMVPVNGRPFMAYLVDQLRENGFERILMLLGYRSEAVIQYFGDGTRFGVAIDYSVMPPEAETGFRLKNAVKTIDNVFFLMYCDNYWPIAFDPMWKHYLANHWAAQVTVYDNRDGLTRSNLRVGADGRISAYDRLRTAADLSGVDIGFLILDRAVLDLLPDDNVSFEATVYPALILHGNLGAYVSDLRYYSIGTMERLEETAAYLATTSTRTTI